MIDGSENINRWLRFEFQSLQNIENRNKKECDKEYWYTTDIEIINFSRTPELEFTITIAYLWHHQLTSCELQMREGLFSESERLLQEISRIPQLF